MWYNIFDTWIPKFSTDSKNVSEFNRVPSNRDRSPSMTERFGLGGGNKFIGFRSVSLK